MNFFNLFNNLILLLIAKYLIFLENHW